MKSIELYTDGSCSGNPGPGGWGAVLCWNGQERELSGGCADTTNNRMELTAAIEGLCALNQPCHVTLFTDSAYLSNAISKGWLYGWKKNGWKKSDKSPVLNRDLWETLDRQLARHEVSFVWVKGHADNAYNNRCDALAVAQTKQYARSDPEGA
ncbi:MAG: ribonuclease HI [Clostridiaceae bacterium]|nr:ribonuclease HI [Clostridiaceae bacterium]